MDMKRVAVALWVIGLAGLGTAAAAESQQDKSAGQPQATAEPPKAIFRGAFKAVKMDVSPPLRDMAPGAVSTFEEEGDKERAFPDAGPFNVGPREVDTAVQSSVGTGRAFEIPGPNVSFDAFSALCGCQPPDSDGDVGPNHYVVMVNLHFAIYNKAGALLFGPVANNTLWSGFGGACQTQNAGDPIVLHDQMANRWIFTQFTSAAPFLNCLAVSTTADPMGPYTRYALPVPTNVLPDYPKWGVWPNAYFLSTREVGASRIGAYAIDRAQVLAGNPAAQIISFSVPGGAGGGATGGDGLLPSDMDGTLPPPAGSPNYFAGTMDNNGPYGATQDAINWWKFTVDFVTPANSSFVLASQIPVAAFNSVMPPPCATSRDCIPQPGTAIRVDHLGYRQRPTWRLAYRNFGTHESLVTNQSVDAGGGMSGVRWYEIRNPNAVPPTLFQQGTYAPGLTDGIHRWMGSIAMDRAGNMGLGYSASNATTVFPGIRFTGRLQADPLGTMPQGEGIIVDGTGSQTSTLRRWGDYTSMNVDPTDECTFWYVNQYIPTTSPGGWRIRVGQFQFPPPSCIPLPVALQGFAVE
jgi:hypothetical protein